MPKNLRKRGKKWWYRFNAKGVPYEGSLETESLAVARERFEVIRRRVSDSRFGIVERRTFDDAARRFAKEHFKTLKPKSRQRYVVSLLNLARHFEGVALIDITSGRLSEFEQARLAERVKPPTVIRDLACLSSLFSRAEEWEWASSNPVKPFRRSRKKSLRESDPRTRYFSIDEEIAVLKNCTAVMWRLVAFAIDTGLRREEQFSLEWADVDLEAGTVTIRPEIAKNGRSREVPLTQRALDILRALPQGIGRAPVFTSYLGKRYSPNSPTVNDGLAKALRKAGVAKAQWHDLRRTCGCRLIQEHEMPLEKVSQWLGHADVRITQQRYAFLRTVDLRKSLRSAEIVQLNGQKLGHQNP